MLQPISRLLVCVHLFAAIVIAAMATPALATDAAPPDLTAISRSLPPLPATDTGWCIPLDGADPWRWTPIRAGVVATALSPDDDDTIAHLRVEYTRTRQQPAGVAIVMPQRALVGVDALVANISATPDHRLFMTLTDAAGIVWTLPTIRATADRTTFTLRLTDLKPDAFQNAGKQVPESPDLSTVVTLTILDISGFMGAPEVECAWTIESIEAVRPAVNATSASRELATDFLAALTTAPERRHETLAQLERAVAAGDRTPKVVFLLGMNHLWIAAEAEADGTVVDEPARARHLAAAIHHLRDAQTLRPTDDRIPGWLHSAESGLARLEGRHADATAALDRLADAAERDPCFHAITLAIMSHDQPVDSPEFRRAAQAMEASFDCGRTGTAPRNSRRAPHTTEGFLVALADMRLRSGDTRGAEMALVAAESQPSFEDWRFRQAVAERLDAIEARRTDGTAPLPPFLFGTQQSASCVGCHGR